MLSSAAFLAAFGNGAPTITNDQFITLESRFIITYTLRYKHMNPNYLPFEKQVHTYRYIDISNCIRLNQLSTTHTHMHMRTHKQETKYIKVKLTAMVKNLHTQKVSNSTIRNDDTI